MSFVGYQIISRPGRKSANGGASVLHGHEFANVAGVERPKINYLVAMCINDFHCLAGVDPGCRARAWRYGVAYAGDLVLAHCDTYNSIKRLKPNPRRAWLLVDRRERRL